MDAIVYGIYELVQCDADTSTNLTMSYLILDKAPTLLPCSAILVLFYLTYLHRHRF